MSRNIKVLKVHQEERLVTLPVSDPFNAQIGYKICGMSFVFGSVFWPGLISPFYKIRIEISSLAG